MTKKRNAVRYWAAFAIITGLGLLGWGASLYLQTQNEVLPIIESSDPSPTSQSTSEPNPAASPIAPTPEPLPTLYPDKPHEGEVIGTISLPTLGLQWPIFEGTTEAQLSKGVGHYSSSVLPGVADNSVLSGHRTSVFNRLGELKIGDTIIVETSAGLFTYSVREFRVVDRSDRTVIVRTPTAVLTLTTCFPFDSPFATSDAFIVSADLMESQLSK